MWWASTEVSALTLTCVTTLSDAGPHAWTTVGDLSIAPSCSFGCPAWPDSPTFPFPQCEVMGCSATLGLFHGCWKCKVGFPCMHSVCCYPLCPLHAPPLKFIWTDWDREAMMLEMQSGTDLCMLGGYFITTMELGLTPGYKVLIGFSIQCLVLWKSQFFSELDKGCWLKQFFCFLI